MPMSQGIRWGILIQAAWLKGSIVAEDAILLSTLIHIKDDMHIGFAEMVLQDVLSRMDPPATAQDHPPIESENVLEMMGSLIVRIIGASGKN